MIFSNSVVFSQPKNLLELRAVEIAVLERYVRGKRRGAGVGRLNRLLMFGHCGYRDLRSSRFVIIHIKILYAIK